jgi:hypothetical protein
VDFDFDNVLGDFCDTILIFNFNNFDSKTMCHVNLGIFRQATFIVKLFRI